MSTDPLTDRLPPQNREAERGVLGGILRDPDTLPTLQQLIVADNFYFDAHQKIYQALCDLSTDGQPIDLVLLYDRLRKNKQLEDVGGQAYLVELWEAVPTGANAEYHAKLVRDTAMVRGLIHASNEILRDSYDRTQSADELVAQAERKIMDIAKQGMVGETKSLTEIVSEAFTRSTRASVRTTWPSAGCRAGTSTWTTSPPGFRTPNWSSSPRGRASEKPPSL